MTEANTVSAARQVRAAVPPVPMLVRTRRGLAAARAALPAPVVLVPTMGALHDGHRSPLRVAREHAGRDGSVVVSIFVNPLQFGPAEDFDRYPRPIERDLAVCAQEGVTAVFHPSVAQIYPAPPVVTVNPGPVGRLLEGASRPGFFDGVLTVVLKLFSLVRPDVGVFGQKDAQQLALVRAMVTDFALGIEIEAVPTVRAADGLALSSRNKYLSPDERAVAPGLHRALAAGAAAASSGPAAVLAAAQEALDAAARPGPADRAPRVDYLALVHADSYQPLPAEPDGDLAGEAVLAIAARVGTTRLIDNVLVRFETERHAADD